MRCNGFEVTVIRATDQITLPEVVSCDGTYIVAEAGIGFRIVVARYQRLHENLQVSSSFEY